MPETTLWWFFRGQHERAMLAATFPNRIAVIVRSLRKILHRTGTLDAALKLKRKFIPAEMAFRPCTPNLLIAVTESLKYLSQFDPGSGDYLEFGIFRGFTFWYAQATARLFGLNDMRFFGFDSFSGLPEISNGLDVSKEFEEGNYECTRPQVESYLSRYGVDWGKTHLVEGAFAESLTSQLRCEKKLAGFRLCVIDCDLYQSTKEALAFAAPLVLDGSIILFDDWNSFGASDQKGERAAFREFLNTNPHWNAEPFTEFGNHGAGFLMGKR